MSRRAFVRAGMMAGGALVAATPTALATVTPLPPRRLAPPGPAAPVSPPILPERRLALRSLHTGERCDACWLRGDDLHGEGLAELDHTMRDWRTGEVFEIDRDLIRLLSDLRDRVGAAPDARFDLISGYRSHATNGALRSRRGALTGVATKSQHMLGKAADIALPGVPLDRLRDTALDMARGGVGYYPADGFVHVDTGRVRRW